MYVTSKSAVTDRIKFFGGFMLFRNVIASFVFTLAIATPVIGLSQESIELNASDVKCNAIQDLSPKVSGKVRLNVSYKNKTLFYSSVQQQQGELCKMAVAQAQMDQGNVMIDPVAQTVLPEKGFYLQSNSKSSSSQYVKLDPAHIRCLHWMLAPKSNRVDLQVQYKNETLLWVDGADQSLATLCETAVHQALDKKTAVYLDIKTYRMLPENGFFKRPSEGKALNNSTKPDAAVVKGGTI